MDNEKDLFIKQKLQEDKLISKKADDLFSKLNNGQFFEDAYDEEFEKTKPTNNVINSVNRFAKFKKILATAASFFIVTGAANVYATSKGYQNIFFMIKYMVTERLETITQKDEILSDRDLTISFEQINIAKGLTISVKKLQILDNEAKLIVSTTENDVFDKSIVPLKFKVLNSKNKVLCETTSSRSEQNYGYILDELTLNEFTEDDNILNLEIYKANSQKLSTLIININERKVEVVGEKEALQKVSEIELKKYLGSVADLSKTMEIKGSGECINISNISYCDGLYKVNYTYFYRGSEKNAEFNIDNYDIYEQDVYIALNSEKGSSKFRLVDMEKPSLIKEANKTKENKTNTINENQKNNTLTNTSTNKTKTNNTKSVINNSN